MCVCVPGGNSSEGTSAKVLGCLLTEMDGLIQYQVTYARELCAFFFFFFKDQRSASSAERHFIVIGTTNRLDMLDPAVLRPGRFDLSVLVPLPDLAARGDILRTSFGGVRVADSVQLDAVCARIAAQTEGANGATLAAIAREAGMVCLRRHVGSEHELTCAVEQCDIDQAMANNHHTQNK